MQIWTKYFRSFFYCLICRLSNVKLLVDFYKRTHRNECQKGLTFICDICCRLYCTNCASQSNDWRGSRLLSLLLCVYQRQGNQVHFQVVATHIFLDHFSSSIFTLECMRIEYALSTRSILISPNEIRFAFSVNWFLLCNNYFWFISLLNLNWFYENA